MNNIKEKSAVGTAIPATENRKTISKVSITDSEEKIKAQKEYQERMSGKKEMIARFIENQKMPYEAKKYYAAGRIMDFIRTAERNGFNTHVSVGGLDSIVLYTFINYADETQQIRKIYGFVPGISASYLEDKSIIKVHKALGIESVKPVKAKNGKLYNKQTILQEFGFPVLSKELAAKIELLQNPSDKNRTVRHAIITGETGAYGGFRTGTRMRLPEKWLNIFGGYENESENVNYRIPDFKVSSKCCYYLKEKPCDDWAKKKHSVPFLGLMASEGGRREKSLKTNGCNYWGKSSARSAPFAIFMRQDILELALEMNTLYKTKLKDQLYIEGVKSGRLRSDFVMPESLIPEIYGTIERLENGTLYTTKAQRTGCNMCGFGIHIEKRPHRFDLLRQRNPKEWEFWMYKCCTDENGNQFGWGRVLDYIGVAWEDDPFAQLSFEEENENA